MNNYAYLIKAKVKATEAKSLFCWFSAKSDSRAEREILNILEDEGITVGRAADHQLPIRTNFPVLDDLPEESVLDSTWCDRYQLDDKNCWQKIEATQPADADADAGEDDNSSNAKSKIIDTLDNIAPMPFRIQLLAQFNAEDLHVYCINKKTRAYLASLELDTDNTYVQNLLLAIENCPEVKAFDMPTLWKLTDAVKKVFPQDKRSELNLLIQFVKAWVGTEHIERGLLVKEWLSGNRVAQVQRTDVNTNAGGGKTDRNPTLTHTLDTLDVDIALATLPMDFNIYDIPGGVYRRAKEIITKNESPFKEWSAALRKRAGILDYSRAAIFALIRRAEENTHHFPELLSRYINKNLTETDHQHPSEEMLAAAGHVPEKSWENEINHRLAAERGEFVPGISDPTDPKWVHEDLTKPQPEIANMGNGVFSIDGLMDSQPAPALSVVDQVRQRAVEEKILQVDTEETSDVQMEKDLNDENSVEPEMPVSETTTDPVTGNAEDSDQTDTLNNDTVHHNDDFRHVMVDLETMGNKSSAPIVSIGAVFFNPASGRTGAEFYAVVSLESSMILGGLPDAGTILWWLKQSPEARSAITMGDAMPLEDALELFSDFISENSDAGSNVQVWGNGASFDNVILRSSYERANIECPWKFWNDRDVRTITEMGEAIGIKPRYDIPFEGDMHNALSDARHQVKYVSAIWQKLIKN